MTRLAGLLLTFVLVLAFVLFVWPTPYRDLPIHEVTNGGISAARINRITGRVEWLERGEAGFR